MTIQNTEQLNKFVNSIGDVPPELIIAKLAEAGVLVSAKIARMLIKPSVTDYAKKAYL